jgi:hypothetical protein
MTMKVENLQMAAWLAREIGEIERYLVAYRGADDISVGVGCYDRTTGLNHQVVLTAAEIGDAIVEVLSRRLAKMRAELRAG